MVTVDKKLRIITQLLSVNHITFVPRIANLITTTNTPRWWVYIHWCVSHHFVQKTCLVKNFLNQNSEHNHLIQAQVKREMLQEFQNLLKYEIIQPKFKFSIDENHFIQKYNIQLEDIRPYKVIHFQEVIHY